MKTCRLVKSSLLISICSILSLSACTSTTDDSEKTKITLNESISIKKSKVIVMPVISTSNKSFNSSILDANYIAVWASDVGKENIIPIPFIALDKIPYAMDAILAIYKTMTDDTHSKNVDKIKGTIAEKFLKDFGEKYGDYSIAFTFLSGDENSYNSTGTITTSMGLLNINSLAWKWNTHKEYKKGLFPVPFNVAVQQTTKVSINDVKKANQEKLY
ncbi:hypothetical protein [Fluviispira multicolorata]|uniref:Lipoprotein n=1 Tax=Fluviispira multicolorata TaxID=2654512 RepID=A0A833N589_9BACT|nr:hypothetical protein [Fluviispira multicolorata]KAB8033129.1 hypothetical protein GCL57_00095 [Fluviispira multicolorata]